MQPPQALPQDEGVLRPDGEDQADRQGKARSVLRESIRDESVDLTYLDPAFNSNASCNVLFTGPSGNESAAQIEAFDDTWHWTVAAEEEGHA
jgi:adenine specific DNA methylase Mod